MQSTFLTQTTRSRQLWQLAALSLAMLATRFHHDSTPFALPDASLAVFFLGGGWLNRRYVWPLLALAVAVDVVAIQFMGVDGYCLTPAYGFLLLAYLLVWQGGRLARPYFALGGLQSAGKLSAWLLAVASLAFVVSNGSFYWFSGEVSGVSLLDYAQGVAAWYSPYLGYSILYAALGLGINALFRRLPATGEALDNVKG